MRRVFALLIVAVVMHCRPTSAQEVPKYQFEMFPGLVRLLVLDASYDRLVVGSDAIIAVPVGEKSVSIAAQKPGYSSIIFVDKLGNLVARAEVTVIPSDRAGRDVVTITRGIH